MALFNDEDFNEVQLSRMEAPDGMVDASDMVFAHERFVEWLKKFISERSESHFDTPSDLITNTDFWNQFSSSGEDSFGPEAQVLIAVSSCFIHVASMIDDSSVEEMVTYVYKKLTHSQYGSNAVAEILTDVCEVLENDTPIAREKYLMKMINRCCEGQEWPTRHASLRIINLLVVMLLAILLDGCDESSRLLILLEFDELVQHTRANTALPYYLEKGDHSE